MASSTVINKPNHTTKFVKNDNYYVSNLKDLTRTTIINDVLPFRIKFTSIVVEGYGPNNVPPIPLQVIGYSNYIL
jgi:hypothetical protein